MSGFCGFVLKEGPSRDKARLVEVLRTVSRNASDEIRLIESSQGAAAGYSLNAFPGIDGICVRDGWFTGVCGDPVWVEQEGDVHAARNSDHFLDALITGDARRFRCARGSFSAFAFDPERNQVHILADGVGVRPVYYYEDSSLFAFATCRRIMAGLLDGRAAVNALALAELVMTRRLTGNDTILENVRG